MMFKRELNALRIERSDSFTAPPAFGLDTSPQKELQVRFVDAIAPFFLSGGLVEAALTYALTLSHIMKARVCRLLTSLRALLVRGISLLIEQSESSMDPTLSDSIVERFATRHLLVSLLWGLGSSLTWDRRQELGDVILKSCHISWRELTRIHGECFRWGVGRGDIVSAPSRGD